MKDEPNLYVTNVLNLYLGLPETPIRVSRTDRNLALDLFQRGVLTSTIEAALLLASVRRICRQSNAPPLGPIRSLHYFLPVIEEITHQPLPADYLHYLRHKLTTHTLQTKANNDAVTPG
ncbi:MAG: hypothetical protein ABI882_02690 [Acidobacteriota bacterium]